MDDHDRASQCTASTMPLPRPHPFWHVSVPSQPGPKMTFLQLKTPFAVTLNGQALHWHVQHPQCVDPATFAQSLQRVCRNCSIRQINPSKMQQDGVPTVWIVLWWHKRLFALFGTTQAVVVMKVTTSPQLACQFFRQKHRLSQPRDLEPNLSQMSHSVSVHSKFTILICKQLKTHVALKKEPQNLFCIPTTEARSPPRPDSSLAKALNIVRFGTCPKVARFKCRQPHGGLSHE